MTKTSTVLLIGGGVLVVILLAKRRETFATGQPAAQPGGLGGLKGFIDDAGGLVDSIKGLWGKTFGSDDSGGEYDISGAYAN
jgi:hypothetical protein